MAKAYNDYMVAMYSGESTDSKLADCISQVATAMEGVKAWFDDNGVSYTATDLIKAADLVMEII